MDTASWQKDGVEISVESYGSTTDYIRFPKIKSKTWSQKLFPSGFKKEFKQIFSLSWPVYLSSLFNYILGPVSLIFCGHLGREELDGVALAISVLNITGLSVCAGLSTACDTLFSQAFGGNNRKLVGIFFQRSLLIITLSCFLCWTIHLNAERILVVLGQRENVARISGEYLLFFMPGLMFNFWYQVLTKYLQNQNFVLGPVFIGAIGNAFNAVAQYVAVYVLALGIRGSAAAQALSFLCMCIGTLLYILITKMYEMTWSGWSWRSLENWRVFLHLAVPGLVMMAIELWSFEIGIFLNGLLGEVELGATSITFQLESILYMLPLGISLSCSIRVGHNLGAANADGAKTAYRVAQTFAWLVCIVSVIILLSLKDILPYIFTDDSTIIELVSRALPIIAFIQFLDSITATAMGALRGCGRQLKGAICNFIGYFVFTVPLAVVLMFVVGIGMMGFWFGLSIGITPICVIYLILIWRIDWSKEVVLATQRSSEVKQKPGTTDKSPLLPESPSCPYEILDPSVVNPSFLSESLEVSMTESVDISYSQAKIIHLCCKRLVAILIVLSVFIAGISVRVFLPVYHCTDVANSTANYSIPSTFPLFTSVRH